MSLLLLFPPPLVAGTVTKTAADDTSAITAGHGPSGTVALTAGNDTSAVTAGYGPNGTLAVTATDDSVVAVGRAYAPFSSDTCIIQDEAGNPILDEAGNDLLIESCGPVAQPTGAGGKWDITRADRDALDRRRKQEDHQRMLARDDEELLCLL